MVYPLLAEVVRVLCIVYTYRGAGQEVGRSCIMLEFKNKKIMVSVD